MFRGAAKAAGSGPIRHALLTLALKGASRVARPVLEENIHRWGEWAGRLCWEEGQAGRQRRLTARARRLTQRPAACAWLTLALARRAPPPPCRAAVGTGHGVHLSSAEEPEDVDADAVCLTAV
jgi:hypothetical protein